MPEKEVDRREEVAIKMGLCTCIDAYTKRGLVAPDCPIHSMCVSEAMDEYFTERSLELLEYMAVKGVVCCMDSDGPYFKVRGEVLTKEQLFGNFL